MNAHAAQALEGGAGPIQLDHANGVVFLEGDVGLFAIGTDGYILRLQVLGERASRLATKTNAEGGEFSVAAIEAREGNRLDCGVSRRGAINADDRNAALGIQRVELVGLALVGHNQLGAIGREGHRIGHDAHGH